MLKIGRDCLVLARCGRLVLVPLKRRSEGAMAPAGAMPWLSVRGGGHSRKEKGRSNGCRPARLTLALRRWSLPHGAAVQGAEVPKGRSEFGKTMVFGLRWMP